MVKVERYGEAPPLVAEILDLYDEGYSVEEIEAEYQDVKRKDGKQKITRASIIRSLDLWGDGYDKPGNTHYFKKTHFRTEWPKACEGALKYLKQKGRA